MGLYSNIVKSGEKVIIKGTLLRTFKPQCDEYVITVSPWRNNFDNRIQKISD